jgi:hypothetical protein
MYGDMLAKTFDRLRDFLARCQCNAAPAWVSAAGQIFGAF